jgi:hypothetical protein
LTLGDAWSAAHAKDIPRGEGALRRWCRARSLLAGRGGPRLYAFISWQLTCCEVTDVRKRDSSMHEYL